MRLAIMANEFMDWGGGIDLLKNIINSLYNELSVEVLFFIPKRTNRQRLILFINKMIGRTELSFQEIFSTKRCDIEEIFNLEFPALKIVHYDMCKLNLLLRKTGVDVVFPVFDVDIIDDDIPHIGYIFDFQHKYLKDFFSDEEKEQRDRCFDNIIKSNKFIAVNANEVYRDIQKFYPSNNIGIYVLPFAPIPRNEWFLDNSALLNKYSLPEKFFLISNQFWLHKNHILTLYALKELHDRYGQCAVHFVYTGKTFDYRDPNYFKKIQSIVLQLKLENYVHFLGYIPKVDQIEVMKKAIAVIQPTSFEGGPGGGAAYDAISLGKRLILSAIPVNLEIQEDVCFFEAGSCADLAKKVNDMFDNYEYAPINVSLQKEKGQERRKKMGTFLVNMFKEVIRNWNEYESKNK